MKNPKESRRKLAEQLVTSLLEMYDQTPEQTAAERRLNKLGFRFSNWIAADPDAEGEPADGGRRGTMVMVKQGATRFGREYREINPDGSVN